MASTHGLHLILNYALNSPETFYVRPRARFDGDVRKPVAVTPKPDDTPASLLMKVREAAGGDIQIDGVRHEHGRRFYEAAEWWASVGFLNQARRSMMRSEVAQKDLLAKRVDALFAEAILKSFYADDALRAIYRERAAKIKGAGGTSIALLAAIRSTIAGVRPKLQKLVLENSLDPKQAAAYAGSADDKNKTPIILEMQQGMIDRGADLTWLSQYPLEVRHASCPASKNSPQTHALACPPLHLSTTCRSNARSAR